VGESARDRAALAACHALGSMMQPRFVGGP
jgi:hypothetical protein